MTEKIKESQKRELLPDVLRGFAIAMVVLGHCIQEGSGMEFKENAMYFYNPWYQFIYSFHMPLFMLLSGYFAWNSMEKAREKQDRWRMLGRKSRALLLPILGWTCVDYLRIIAVNGSKAVTVSGFVLSFLTNAWFLWAVFWCFLITFFMHFFCKDSVILYVLGFLGMFFLPDGLGLGAYKYMLPYFIAAFYFHGWRKAHQEEMEKYFSHDTIWLVGAGIVFAVLFLFFDENSFIYLSGYKLIGKDVLTQLKIDGYRLLIGFVGAGFFILLWRKLIKTAKGWRFPVLAALGRHSLGIYMVSGYLILEAGARFGAYMKPNYGWNLLQMTAVLALSYGITRLLQKIPVLKYLVGDSYEKVGTGSSGAHF